MDYPTKVLMVCAIPLVVLFVPALLTLAWCVAKEKYTK